VPPGEGKATGRVTFGRAGYRKRQLEVGKEESSRVWDFRTRKVWTAELEAPSGAGTRTPGDRRSRRLARQGPARAHRREGSSEKGKRKSSAVFGQGRVTQEGGTRGLASLKKGTRPVTGDAVPCPCSLESSFLSGGKGKTMKSITNKREGACQKRGGFAIDGNWRPTPTWCQQEEEGGQKRTTIKNPTFAKPLGKRSLSGEGAPRNGTNFSGKRPTIFIRMNLRHQVSPPRSGACRGGGFHGAMEGWRKSKEFLSFLSRNRAGFSTTRGARFRTLRHD